MAIKFEKKVILGSVTSFVVAAIGFIAVFFPDLFNLQKKKVNELEIVLQNKNDLQELFKFIDGNRGNFVKLNIGFCPNPSVDNINILSSQDYHEFFAENGIPQIQNDYGVGMVNIVDENDEYINDIMDKDFYLEQFKAFNLPTAYDLISKYRSKAPFDKKKYFPSKFELAYFEIAAFVIDYVNYAVEYQFDEILKNKYKVTYTNYPRYENTEKERKDFIVFANIYKNAPVYYLEKGAFARYNCHGCYKDFDNEKANYPFDELIIDKISNKGKEYKWVVGRTQEIKKLFPKDELVTKLANICENKVYTTEKLELQMLGYFSGYFAVNEGTEYSEQNESSLLKDFISVETPVNHYSAIVLEPIDKKEFDLKNY